jgi:alcohol dehydrogenase
MNFTYYIPTRILFGKGQLDKLHQQVLPGKKALIVISAGQSVRRNGYLARLEKQLDLAAVEYVVFDRILPNPIKEHVMEASKLVREQGCDFVIGLGGGSSIDSAKAIAIMATNEGDLWDYIGSGTGLGKTVVIDPLPIVAITTTAGTGTEADPWFVITHEGANEKPGFGFDKTFPFLSLVDPDLMLTVSPDFTAYQGFDALFHSTEGFISSLATAISDLYALKAIELVGKNLADAVINGQNKEARVNLALASTLSGMVESTSDCTSEHAIAHALGAFHHQLPHGAGLIMVSQAYYIHLARIHPDDGRMIAMAQALGKADARKSMDFVEALAELQVNCGVARLKMSDYGIRKANFRQYIANARSTMGGLFDGDPAPLSDNDWVAILEASYR